MKIKVSKEVSTDSDPTPLQSLFVALAVSRDVKAEAKAVKAVLFLWKRKREKPTASAPTYVI